MNKQYIKKLIELAKQVDKEISSKKLETVKYLVGYILALEGMNNISYKSEKEEKEVDKDSCPICGCLYDDKAKGAAGRNGSCECSCRHYSPGYKGFKI